MPSLREICSPKFQEGSNIMGMEKAERNCVVCGKPLEKKQKKCCSRSCSATYGNRNARGEKARNWKGGRNLHSEDYIRIYKPNHPSACSYGYVYEHRFVMEQRIGRHLHTHEIVHHINGIKTDNRIENLELISNQSEHCKFHNSLRKTG